MTIPGAASNLDVNALQAVLGVHQACLISDCTDSKAGGMADSPRLQKAREQLQDAREQAATGEGGDEPDPDVVDAEVVAETPPKDEEASDSGVGADVRSYLESDRPASRESPTAESGTNLLPQRDWESWRPHSKEEAAASLRTARSERAESERDALLERRGLDPEAVAQQAAHLRRNFNEEARPPTPAKEISDEDHQRLINRIDEERRRLPGSSAAAETSGGDHQRLLEHLDEELGPYAPDDREV